MPARLLVDEAADLFRSLGAPRWAVETERPVQSQRLGRNPAAASSSSASASVAPGSWRR